MIFHRVKIFKNEHNEDVLQNNPLHCLRTTTCILLKVIIDGKNKGRII